METKTDEIIVLHLSFGIKIDSRCNVYVEYVRKLLSNNFFMKGPLLCPHTKKGNPCYIENPVIIALSSFSYTSESVQAAEWSNVNISLCFCTHSLSKVALLIICSYTLTLTFLMPTVCN